MGPEPDPGPMGSVGASGGGGRWTSRELEVVDLRQSLDRAGPDDAFATPALLKAPPTPSHRVVGALSDEGQVLVTLGIGCEGSPEP